MKNLDERLRDPRAHGDAPDPEEVRMLAERVLARFAAERRAPAPEEITAAPEAVRRPRARAWRDLAVGVGLAVAAVGLFEPLRAALTALGEAVADAGAAQADAGAADPAALLEILAASPMLLALGAAAVAVLATPPLRALVLGEPR